MTGPAGIEETYSVVEMLRIHSPSEHTVNGKNMAAELRMEWHTDCELVANSCPMAALVIFFD